MLDYIEANCELPSLDDKASYDQDSGMWELYFEELLPSWYNRGEGEHPDLITLHFESEQEAQEILNQQTKILNKRNQENEVNSENQEPVLS
jgi:hypothetical protein